MLGSGLDKIIDNFESKIIIPYTDIPDFHNTGVEGHKGEFIYGYLKDIPILCARGRFHYYEGFTFDQIGSIIEIFNYFSPKLTIITNSSGCLNLDWEIGNFMIANKFLDFSFLNSKKIKIHKVENNKENLNKQQLKQQPKRKVTNKQMQQPISGSVNKIDETVKAKPPVKPPVKPKTSQKMRTKKPPMPPRKPRVHKEEKKDSGMFKQMKDKFIGKPKDEGGN